LTQRKQDRYHNTDRQTNTGTMHFKYIIIFCLFTFFFSCRNDEIIQISEEPIETGESEDIGERVISGTVLNEVGEVLKDAEINLYLGKDLKQTTTTDNEGSFLFVVESAEEYFLYFDEQDYFPSLLKVDSSEPQSNEIQLNVYSGDNINDSFDWLEFDWITVKGEMVNEFGLPMPGVSFLVKHLSFDFNSLYITNEEGEFEYLVAKQVPHGILPLSHCSQFSFSIQLGFENDTTLDPIVIEESLVQAFNLSGFVRDCNGDRILDEGMIEVELISTSGVVSSEIINHQAGFYNSVSIVCEEVTLVKFYSVPERTLLGTLPNLEGELERDYDVIICEDIEVEDIVFSLKIDGEEMTFENIAFACHEENELAIEFESIDKFGDSGYLSFDLAQNPSLGLNIISDLILEINDWHFYQGHGDLELNIDVYPEINFEIFSGNISCQIKDLNNNILEMECEFQIPLFIK